MLRALFSLDSSISVSPTANARSCSIKMSSLVVAAASDHPPGGSAACANPALEDLAGIAPNRRSGIPQVAELRLFHLAIDRQPDEHRSPAFACACFLVRSVTPNAYVHRIARYRTTG